MRQRNSCLGHGVKISVVKGGGDSSIWSGLCYIERKDETNWFVPQQVTTKSIGLFLKVSTKNTGLLI